MTLTVGQTARRSRSVSPRDIELFTELTGDRDQDAHVVVDGTALVWTEPL